VPEYQECDSYEGIPGLYTEGTVMLASTRFTGGKHSAHR